MADVRFISRQPSTYPVASQKGILREFVQAAVQRKGGYDLQHPHPGVTPLNELLE